MGGRLTSYFSRMANDGSVDGASILTGANRSPPPKEEEIKLHGRLVRLG